LAADDAEDGAGGDGAGEDMCGEDGFAEALVFGQGRVGEAARHGGNAAAAAAAAADDDDDVVVGSTSMPGSQAVAVRGEKTSTSAPCEDCSCAGRTGGLVDGDGGCGGGAVVVAVAAAVVEKTPDGRRWVKVGRLEVLGDHGPICMCSLGTAALR
jgi:hypothetical protein